MSFEVSSSTPGYEQKFDEILGLPQDEQGPMIAQIVKPLSIAPPLEEWASIQDGTGSKKIPFTASEIADIRKGQETLATLVYVASSGSGAAREFCFGVGPAFPRTEGALTDRYRSVWGIMDAALGAHVAMVADKGTAWESVGEVAESFSVMKNLPAHLIAHPEGQAVPHH